MDLCTVGRVIYPGYQLFLWHNPHEAFAPGLGAGSRFCLVLVEKGSGILRLGGRQMAITAPVLCCLNEAERPELVQASGLEAQAIYFHPEVINSDFTLENVKLPPAAFNATGVQDQAWLRPFTEREPGRSIMLSIGPMTAKRLALLFAKVAQELADQYDKDWPCRSRTFFLEILFLTERLWTEADAAEVCILGETDGAYDVRAVILYLHTHYQEKITIDSLTRIFHTNRTTLAMQFRQATGQSIMAYLKNLRIRAASLMLRDTILPVSEIMDRVGFSDSTHFGRTFRESTGYRPSEYRQKYCWMLLPH